jgi:hypothetical protein
MALIFVLGCGSQKAPEKTTSETTVEQHSADNGHDHSAHAGELKPQTKCPVMGGDIDKTMYVDQGGKRIYMCCEHCREELTKNFDAHVKKLKEMGQKPETL